MNMKLLGGMITLVTDLDIDDSGNATCTDTEEGDDLDPTVGYHFGFYSRPKTKVSGLVVKIGGKGNHSIAIAFRDRQYEMKLQKGECGVQNAFGASTLWDQNGNVITTPGSGGTVQLAGNVYSLPKLETLLSDLNTLVTNLATWVPLVVTGVSTAPSGTAADPGVAAAATAIATAIGAGAYKSTKAKNG